MQEGRGAFFWNRKEELIVLSLREGEPGGGMGGEGDLIGVDGESDAGGAGEAGKVGSQTIAEVEHRGGKAMTDEPLAFGEAWGEGEVAVGARAAEFACNKKGVARFGARAGGGYFFWGGSEEREGEEKLPSADGLPSDEGEMELFRETGQSLISLTDTGGGVGMGATDGEENGAGSCASGGEIAERASESFAAEEGGGGGAGEVDAFDDGIGFENEVEVFRKSGEDGAVVTQRVANACGGLAT